MVSRRSDTWAPLDRVRGHACAVSKGQRLMCPQVSLVPLRSFVYKPNLLETRNCANSSEVLVVRGHSFNSFKDLEPLAVQRLTFAKQMFCTFSGACAVSTTLTFRSTYPTELISQISLDIFYSDLEAD